MLADTGMCCARHPKVQTVVRCASCGTPICTKCMVTTPVGMKCPDCGRSANTALFKVSPGRFALAGIVSLAAGVVAGFLGGLGFLVILVGPAYGYLAGNLILRASGMKRGLKLEALAGVCMVVGGLGFRLGQPLASGAPVSHIVGLLADPFFWVGLAIATGCAVSKIRYL